VNGRPVGRGAGAFSGSYEQREDGTWTRRSHLSRFGPTDLARADDEAVEEAFRRSIEKVRGEHTVCRALEEGMSAADAFATYGIM